MSNLRYNIATMKNNLLIKNLYEKLCSELEGINFSEPVAVVYNPLLYASDGVEKYLRYSDGSKRAIFLGMNPGPWGMAQTGVPFGEVEAVKNFLGFDELTITPPPNEHELYKVRGLDCQRSEVSGKRLWGLFKEKFGTAENFFRDHFVLNYCPLLLLARSGKDRVRNFTPDKLGKSEREKLFAACDSCLRAVIEILKPEYVVGVGNFAHERAAQALSGMNIKITKILHPSPASPQSNRDWGGKVTEQLIASGVWQ